MMKRVSSYRWLILFYHRESIQIKMILICRNIATKQPIQDAHMILCFPNLAHDGSKVFLPLVNSVLVLP